MKPIAALAGAALAATVALPAFSADLTARISLQLPLNFLGTLLLTYLL